jgi:hypothetical protein
MKQLTTFIAQDTGPDQSIEPLTIDFSEALPAEPGNFWARANLFWQEAMRLESALFGVMPGALYDQLLAQMLTRRASLLIVPHAIARTTALVQSPTDDAILGNGAPLLPLLEQLRQEFAEKVVALVGSHARSIEVSLNLHDADPQMFADAVALDWHISHSSGTAWADSSNSRYTRSGDVTLFTNDTSAVLTARQQQEQRHASH